LLRIAVLPQLGGLVLPILRDAASFDRLLLVLAIVLARRGNQAGIDDLSRHSDVTRLPQRRIEPLKQRLDGTGLGELLPE
jgi:hypothetical protein